MTACVCTKHCRQLFIATFFVIANFILDAKQPSHPSTAEWINVIQSHSGVLLRNKNKLLLHALMNLRIIMLKMVTETRLKVSIIRNSVCLRYKLLFSNRKSRSFRGTRGRSRESGREKQKRLSEVRDTSLPLTVASNVVIQTVPWEHAPR